MKLPDLSYILLASYPKTLPMIAPGGTRIALISVTISRSCGRWPKFGRVAIGNTPSANSIAISREEGVSGTYGT